MMHTRTFQDKIKSVKGCFKWFFLNAPWICLLLVRVQQNHISNTTNLLFGGLFLFPSVQPSASYDWSVSHNNSWSCSTSGQKQIFIRPFGTVDVFISTAINTQNLHQPMSQAHGPLDICICAIYHLSIFGESSQVDIANKQSNYTKEP